MTKQAFPCDDLYAQDGKVYRDPGMTLRDYFAAKSLHSIMQPNPVTGQFAQVSDFPVCAEQAYKLADEMLKARSK